MLGFASVLLVLAASQTHAELLKSRRLLAGEDGFELVERLTSYELHDFSNHHPSRRALAQAGSEKTIEYELEILGRRVLLNLERHDDLFHADYVHYLLDHQGQVLSTEPKLDCVYRGVELNSESVSHASVTLCGNQVRATVVHAKDTGESFTIQPLKNGVHLAYRHLDQIDLEYKCGNGPEDRFLSDAVLEHNHDDHQDERRQLSGTAKLLGVSFVNDYKRYLQYGGQVHAHATSLAGVSNALFQQLGNAQFPSTYTITLQITSMYTFTMGDPWTHPAASSSLSCANSQTCNTVPVDGNGEVNATEALYAFNTWRLTELYPLQNNAIRGGADVGHLLTGYTFAGSTIGLASLGAACTTSRSSTTQATDITDAQISSTITHEIGHNLGVQHTNIPPPGFASCLGLANATDIMAASSAGANTNWEACSIQYLKLFFEGSTYTNNPCMDTSSTTLVDGSPVCGDGLIQGDEECDCINNDCTGVDSCCNGATCRLISPATCSQQDACCDSSCQIVTNTAQVCRAAISSCDNAETCDGVHASCPFDEFSETGATCTTTLTGATGTCYHKECKDATEDCHKLGLAQDAANRWNATCSSETGTESVGECIAYCKLSTCTSLQGCCKYFTSSVVSYSDGVQCNDGKACFNGQCLPFESIPAPTNPNCTNGVFGDSETDLDCGGLQCYGCAANKNCKVDTDCAFPGLCNTTILYTNPFNNQTGYGKCSATGKVGQDTNNEVIQQVLNWLEANVVIWAPIVGGVALLLIVLCCCPIKYLCCCGNSSQNNKNAAAMGMQRAQTSFRTFRPQPQEQGLAVRG